MTDTQVNQPEQPKKDGRGGARPGAGMPKGHVTKRVKERQIVKKAFLDRVAKHADELFNAQYSLAIGERVLMVQITEGEGKNRRRYHEIVDNKEIIKQFLDHEEGINGAESLDDDKHYYYLTTRPANNLAIDSMLNRAFGKAPEKIELEGGFFKDTELIVKILKADDGAADTNPETGTSVGTS